MLCDDNPQGGRSLRSDRFEWPARYGSLRRRHMHARAHRYLVPAAAAVTRPAAAITTSTGAAAARCATEPADVAAASAIASAAGRLLATSLTATA